MSDRIKVELTVAELAALQSAARIGTLDEQIDEIGWSAPKKAAFTRAMAKLESALNSQGPRARRSRAS